MNALVLRALARDPARRFRRAADLRDALLRVRRPAPRVPSHPRVLRLRLPPVAPLIAALAVLADTSSPAPSTSSEPTAEPIAVPTAAPPAAATPTPVVATKGDPAGAILAFYELISGHDYASALGMWSDRMRATYPPQTNIWGRFDRTRSIVARSASVTSANPGSAAVAVDLIETLSDGTIRHWVCSWHPVRSRPGRLFDQPGLRPA